MTFKAVESRSLRQRLQRDQRGSLLVEAALIVPLVLVATLLLLGLGFMAYSRAEMILRTFEWTERAAYVWKDSHKDPLTGAFSYEETDDVYGSLISEGVGLLGAAFQGFRQAELKLPGGSVSGAGLSGAKLLRSAETRLPVSGSAIYLNRLMESEILADWSSARAMQRNSDSIFAVGSAPVKVSSYVSDPVGLLRTIDLITSYAPKIKARFRSPGAMSEELSGYLPGGEERPPIRSEREAKAYIQQLVHGEAMKVATSIGSRHIDALDRDGIMHEAKYTVNKTDAKQQIQKDAELIRTGAVKGVVWHFFPLVRTGSCDLTPSLKKSLEESGIMVIIHR